MSQENNSSENAPEKAKEYRKLILLGVLGVVLIGVLYFQLFSGGDPGERVTATQPKSPPAKPSPTPRAYRNADEIVSQPLDLASLTNRASTAGGTGRNIFIYPTPTPPP